jgi:hypothetical protein
MNKNQAGFSVVEILVGCVLVGLIGLTGWYVRDNHQTKPVRNASKSSTQKAAAQATKKSVYKIPDGYKVYENIGVGMKLAYPQDWKLVVNEPTSCPFGDNLYDSQSCPLDILLSPPEYANDAGNAADSGLLEAVWYEGQNLADSITARNFELNKYSTDKATITKTDNFTANSYPTFYVRAVASGWTDNFWLMKAPNFYMRLTNRELNTEYNGGDGSIAKVRDYAKYTPTISQIVNTIAPLNQ